VSEARFLDLLVLQELCSTVKRQNESHESHEEQSIPSDLKPMRQEVKLGYVTNCADKLAGEFSATQQRKHLFGLQPNQSRMKQFPIVLISGEQGVFTRSGLIRGPGCTGVLTVKMLFVIHVS